MKLHHCCNCDRKIAKRTNHCWFGQMHPDARTTWRQFTEHPKSWEEAQQLVGNAKVVSVKWAKDDAHGSYIHDCTTWDGESYVDEFFCTNRCAIAYAHAMARVTHGRRA